eukprot:GHVR01186210.1.p1 GENE.GHVR01186210.1~~GHVR01186210.1.p1  ORF type:complete len:154 (+),score=0.25 GHVR01186210.1:127-588(+)
MITLIHDRINYAKSKSEMLDSLLSLILALEDKFTSETLIQPILHKHLRSDDWNTRKTSVDICYALMVVKEEINEALHKIITELKYDKIKHVREAVGNYQALYKQLYVEEESFRDKKLSTTAIKTHHKLTESKSPSTIRNMKNIEINSNLSHSL